LYTEKLWLAAVEIDPSTQVKPLLDGSVMEEMIEAFPIKLEAARDLCLSGDIVDAKTEIALERFARLITNEAG